MIENQIRKEINNEITKEIDEDTSEVKSSPVVKVQKGSEWVSTPKRNQKHLIITITDSSKTKKESKN